MFKLGWLLLHSRDCSVFILGDAEYGERLSGPHTRVMIGHYLENQPAFIADPPIILRDDLNSRRAADQ